MPGGAMVVWIPAIIGGPATAGGTPVAPPGATAAAQPVLCAVEPTNTAVLTEAGMPAGQKVVVIADTEMACQAINGTVANPTTASAGGAN